MSSSTIVTGAVVPARPEKIITVSLTVPETAGDVLEREVGVALDQMEPVLDWVRRQGGKVTVTGMPAVE